jgi:hypothetical protein
LAENSGKRIEARSPAAVTSAGIVGELIERAGSCGFRCVDRLPAVT